MTTKVIGSGLICLDIIYNKNELDKGIYTIGGSCGNVISILSYFNCLAYPILPYKKDDKTYQLVNKEFNNLNVNQDLVIEDNNYSIPIILQENYKSTHKFKFKNPLKNDSLPKYKSLDSNIIEYVANSKVTPDFFYFDKCNSPNLELAKFYKKRGVTIFFEPSKVSCAKIFKECLRHTDIVKYSHDRFDEIDSYITTNIPVEIQTMGGKGLKFRVNKKNWVYQSAKQVKHVIDTSGCGDICSVGLIRYLSNKLELNETNVYRGLEIGQVMSAINCTFIGAKTFVNHIKSDDFMDLVDKFLHVDIISLKNNYNKQHKPKIDIKKFLKELEH